MPGKRRVVWAVAPAINLSGQGGVDPLLQADIVYSQLQQVHGVTAIPVNRVCEVYSAMHLERVQSADQAAQVCELLGCDALLVPTVTLYDPYNPPKFGAALQLFAKRLGLERSKAPDARELARRASPGENESLPPPSNDFRQVVGIFDGIGLAGAAAVLDPDAKADDLGIGALGELANALGGGFGQLHDLRARPRFWLG